LIFAAILEASPAVSPHRPEPVTKMEQMPIMSGTYLLRQFHMSFTCPGLEDPRFCRGADVMSSTSRQVIRRLQGLRRTC